MCARYNQYPLYSFIVATGYGPRLHWRLYSLSSIPTSIIAAQSNNTFKDVGHLVNFNGENYSDYRCEFLAMMEQLDLKIMLDANTEAEQVEARPAEVIFSVSNYVRVPYIVCMVLTHSDLFVKT
jgi:hypothetical protein